MLISKTTRQANNGANSAVYEIDNPENATSNNRHKILCFSCYFVKKKKKKEV